MRSATRSVALAVLALVLAPGRARADRLDDIWRRERGLPAWRLRGRRRGLRGARPPGRGSADLAFNLGDAYFRKGALGPAIWSFERALALDPGDEDARYNLDKARKLAAGRAKTAWRARSRTRPGSGSSRSVVGDS